MQWKYLFAVLAAFALSTRATGAENVNLVSEEVDLELVLAVDASGSVSSDLFEAQRSGFADAFRKPYLQRALLSGPLQKVAVVYFEYSGYSEQQLIVPWTILTGVEDMELFADALESSTISGTGGQTSISGAMIFAKGLLEGNDYTAFRKVVDVTGNGRNSDGPSVEQGLGALRDAGAIVNGLVLPEPNVIDAGPYAPLFSGYDGPLDDYYRTEVIGGPGAFAIQVDAKHGYGDAILRKLVLEVAWVDSGETAH